MILRLVRLTISFPLCRAILIFLASTAWAQPQPGSDRPRASTPQARVLALNIPAQVPAPGQAQPSNSFRSSIPILPSLTMPTASKTSIISTFLPLNSPGNIGPPVTTMVGISNRPAAIKCPGTISSQAGIITIPSRAWALTIISMELAITSRDGREYRIPSCPMARPSHTAMV